MHIVRKQPWVWVFVLVGKPCLQRDFPLCLSSGAHSISGKALLCWTFYCLFSPFPFIPYYFESRSTKGYYLGHLLGPGALLN